MPDSIDLFAQAAGVSRSRAKQMLANHPDAANRLASIEAVASALRSTSEVEALHSITPADLVDIAAEPASAEALAELVDIRARNRARATIAAHASWANTADPSARTQPARDAFRLKFEQEVDPDGTMDPVERRRRGESARKAHYARLAFRSAQARKARRITDTKEHR